MLHDIEMILILKFILVFLVALFTRSSQWD